MELLKIMKVSVLPWLWFNGLKKKTGPASRHISTQEEREAFFQEPVIRVVGHFAAGSENEKTWNQIANSGQIGDFELAHVTDDALYAGQKKDSVAIFRFSEDPIVYTGEFNENDISTWVLSEAYPLIDELAQKTWQRSSTTKLPLLALFVAEYNEETF